MDDKLETDKLVPMLSKLKETYVISKKNWSKDLKKTFFKQFVDRVRSMKLFPIEDSRTTKVIHLDEFGKKSMVSGIFMVNAATIYTFINFTYTFSVRDCNPSIYNVSIHRIYGNNVKNYENVLYFATAVAVLMKVVSIFSYHYALKKYMML